MTTYLIVPAFSDQAGQCRIVMRPGPAPRGRSALMHYRNYPDQWREAGLMNSSGQLVCLDAPDHVREEFIDCQPLMAGLSIDDGLELAAAPY
jgi:hypothetical protein